MKRFTLVFIALAVLSGCAGRAMGMKDPAVQIAEIQAKAQVEAIKALAEALSRVSPTPTPSPTPEVK